MFSFDVSIYSYSGELVYDFVMQVSSDDQDNRLEIYQTTVDVLKPEIDKLKAFYRFQQNAVQRFCAEVKRLSNPEKLKSFVSETTKLTLAKMIDLFTTLNALKNAKACLRNDFSFFRRYFPLILFCY